MYRIEVAPGEETVFRTIEELAVGIRNGVITPRARIYHHASEKWLPIGLHPHYKKALEMPAASASPAPVTATTPIPTPSRLKAHPSAHPSAHPPAHPQPHSFAHAPEPKPVREPKPTPEPKPVPKAAAAPKIPAPVQSPVIAMQNEVLRDLPVVLIPEPLPWNVPAPRVAAPPVQAHAPAVHAPAVHAPAHASVRHLPVAYAPLEFSMPVEERQDADTEELLLHRPTARRSRRMGGRPVLLLGSAAALVIGTHLVLTATPSASADPVEAPAPAPVAGNEEPEDSPELPPPGGDQPAAETRAIETHATEARVTEAPATAAPRVTIAPARVPMTPGPAFAASVPARPGADSAAQAKATTPAPAPSSAPVAPSIAPAPAAMDLALPDLPPDSVMPTARTGDTMGMRKILRALNGAKPAEASAAP